MMQVVVQEDNAALAELEVTFPNFQFGFENRAVPAETPVQIRALR